MHTLGGTEEKLLLQLRELIPSVVARAQKESQEVAALKQQTIWGVDIEARGDATDIVLLKYLRAEELNVTKAADRLVQTLVFRADCQIDALAKAELPDHFQGHDFISGTDVDGRPVMISRFGSMDLKKVFGDVEAFVRYRAQLMERAVAMLPFKRGEAEDLCQVHDYSGVPLSEHSVAKDGVSAISKVFGEHYPEMKGKTIFVNFPAAFSKLFKAFSVFIPERTRKKFIILGKEDQEAVFEHIRPEIYPEALGGMLRDPPSRLSTQCHVVSVWKTEEVDLLEVNEPADVLWELRVCAMEIAYEVVFVPVGDGGQEETVIKRSEDRQYLQVADGVVAGRWRAEVPGKVKCRFRNECAWFKSRLCICRAEVSQ